MKKFELWLDESGDFSTNDMELKNNPSLVGGVLSEKGAITIEELKELYISKSGSTTIHLNEMKENVGCFVCDVLNDLTDKVEAFVIFENTERLLNINEDDTYLNVLSQGVVKLYEELVIKYEDIELEVLIAVRSSNKFNYVEIIGQSEYEKHVKKKILYGDLDSIINGNRLNLTLGSARKNQKLMLADIVCNSYLTMGAKKFNGYEDKIIKIMEEKIYKFSLTERLAETLINKYIFEENFSNAILLILTSKSLNGNINRKKLILDRFASLENGTINLHLINIVNYLNCLIINRKFTEGKEYLLNVESFLLHELENRGIENKLNGDYHKFKFDIKLLLLTIYTHEGDTLASRKIILECNDKIGTYITNFENLNQYLIFKIREGIHLQNIFDFYGSVKKMEKLILMINDILEVLPMATGFNDIGENIKSELLMEARGTKLLANILRIRQVKLKERGSFLKELRKESDEIIEGFDSSYDKSIQYQFRSNLECEVGNYTEAINYLGKAMDDEGNGIRFLAKAVINSTSPYPMMHYTKIMSEASMDKQKIAKELYEALVYERFEDSRWIGLREAECNYPSFVTYWRIGNYLIEDNSISAALKYINKAIAIGNRHSKNLTLRGINLGAMASKLLALKKGVSNQVKDNEVIAFQKKFIREVEEFQGLDLPLKMQKYFKDFIEINLVNDEESIKKLVRKISF
ncbi:hypothetical protein LGK97_06470 [Clostridium sp. CS001]|uniref:hypothetical protein n=1 Tax=Clostridium sp. CS001 TaxID=2880648 RepID=UPI001CF197F0|nr:hypothetical protein [Clostridium sp. CS001]MCB2289409.1 hypothetical protein [Clostridium sp. CS001]